jgi:cytochrome c oxidase cbb3-type subunit I/II
MSTTRPSTSAAAPSAETWTDTVTYNDKVVRQFLLATVLWGVVGMLVGLIIASQLAWPQLNVLPELSFGRLRPLHTNAVIFAFVGNMMFAGVYYSTQRLLKARMGHDTLSAIHFWGWQAIIVSAALTLPFGITQSKEYAELEWPIDIAVAVVWVVFAVNFFWTMAVRREKHLYVALWFYIATIVTIAILYIVNNLAIPVFGAGIKSYVVWSGVQDALVQWWYGHNAVAFFLTTPILGIMYYFLPKAADRPVYSYRLSIIHFWALVFMYIWAGPHHLLYTALPDWAQSMGMLFSLMLWAPSWGGMLNGLLTLRGAWDRVRADPVLKFMVAGVTFYGMSTFEGPLLAIKEVSSLAHYTDWIVGHAHSGALGWNGFFAAALLYWLMPRLYGTKLYSTRAADAHFWLGTLGILFYAFAMWASGITQGLMWRALTPDGALQYPSFVETLVAIRPMYIFRLIGGLMYFAGILMMAWNIIMTVRSGSPVDVTVKAVPLPVDDVPWSKIVFSKPIVVSVTGVVATILFLVGDLVARPLVFVALIGVIVVTWGYTAMTKEGAGFHRQLEGRPLIFTVLALLGVLVGGIVELVPTIVVDKAVPKEGETATPYRPLELAGRDLYVREGCYVCHSQMIRPMIMEKLRYGEPSTAGESIYDHPFQWVSKRTGPDLARTGGKMPNLWHWQHLNDPRSTSPGSNMPPYAFMAQKHVSNDEIVARMRVQQTLGTPYTDAEIQAAPAMMAAQQKFIADDLAKNGVTALADSEMVALIAYLQRVGKHPTNPLENVPGMAAAAVATTSPPSPPPGGEEER